MTLPNLMPDPEELTTTFLRAKLTAPTASVDVRWPTSFNGTQSFVLVERVGGPPDRVARGTWLDKPLIQVSAGAPSKAQAQALSAEMRAWMVLMHEYYITSPVVTFVEELVGPLWIPDANYSPAGRYLVQFEMSVHN